MKDVIAWIIIWLIAMSAGYLMMEREKDKWKKL